MKKINISEFYTDLPPKLKVMPRRLYAKKMIFQKIVQHFEEFHVYSEKEVTSILQPIYVDYATLWRYLIDYGFLTRTRDGMEYQKAPELEDVGDHL